MGGKTRVPYIAASVIGSLRHVAHIDNRILPFEFVFILARPNVYKEDKVVFTITIAQTQRLDPRRLVVHEQCDSGSDRFCDHMDRSTSKLSLDEVIKHNR